MWKIFGHRNTNIDQHSWISRIKNDIGGVYKISGLHSDRFGFEESIEQKVIELQEAKKNVIDQVIADNDENIIKLSDSDIQYLLN